jgi:twitching motility protein PilT
MKAIDSVLQILVQQGGTELRLASDQRPQMFKEDAELPLTFPAMSAERMRYLLEDLWTAHRAELEQRGQLSVAYRSAELGTFAVRLMQPNQSALEVRFRRTEAAADAPEPPPSSRGSISSSLETADAISADPGNQLPPALIALLQRAVARGASDLHLSPRRAPVLRINGALEALDGDAGVDVSPLLDGSERGEQIRTRGSVDRAFDLPGLGRVRVNVYASDEGLCAAVRILRREAPNLSELNLPPQVAPLVDLPHGLVIACGPTGSGKSTTLAALIQHTLAARPRVLVTLEDPIEYVIRPKAAGLVRQREVGTHVRDFATGLRDALREDPDVLLIGEMRDPETISLALTAAETGHLVFASLHSRTAPSAVERIVDTYAPERQRQIRVQLADSLRAVIAQRLLPSADGNGRVPAVELLRVHYGVANLIREGRTAQIVNALQGGGEDGMLVLERHLADLVRSNRVRRDTALAAANDAAALSEYLRA